MPIEYSVSDIKDSTSASSPDIFKQALSGARDGICAVYKDRPGFFTNQDNALDTFPVLHEAGQLSRSMMDNFCSDKPLPPPPASPFDGGQCVCQLVDVRSSYSDKDGNVSINGITTSVYTPIRGITTDMVNGFPTDAVISSVCDSTKTKIIGTKKDYVRQKPVSGGGASFITQVIPRSSSPDSCGNPPVQDPRDRRITPPNFTFNPPVVSPRAPGVNVNVPVVVLPPVLIRPTATANITLNIPINIGGLNFNFSGDKISFRGGDEIDNSSITNAITNAQTNINTSITNSITATATNITSSRDNINSTIGVVNTNLTNQVNNSATTVRNNVKTDTTSLINASDTTVNNNTTASISTAISNINANTSAVSNSAIVAVNNNTNTGIATTNNNLAIVATKVDAVKLDVTDVKASVQIAVNNTGNIIAKQDDCICPADPLAPTVNPRVRQPSQKSNDDPKIQAVLVTLTKLPVKGLWGGGGGAPDKHIAGWFAWKMSGGGYAPQSPINYQKSTFVKPTHAVGYAYTLTNKAEGFATEYVLT